MLGWCLRFTTVPRPRALFFHLERASMATRWSRFRLPPKGTWVGFTLFRFTLMRNGKTAKPECSSISSALMSRHSRGALLASGKTRTRICHTYELRHSMTKSDANLVKSANSMKAGTHGIWRRGRDSNPRDPFEPNGFQDRRFQPLTHPSVSNSTLAKRGDILLHLSFRRAGVICAG
jgi:hypothetical protein